MSVAEPHDVCIEVPHGHHLLSVLLPNAFSSATLLDPVSESAFCCKQAVGQARNQYFSALLTFSGHTQWMRLTGIADA